MKTNKLVEDYHRHNRYHLAWSIVAAFSFLVLFLLSWPTEATFSQNIHGKVFVLALALCLGMFLAGSALLLSSSTKHMRIRWWAWLLAILAYATGLAGLTTALFIKARGQVDLDNTFGAYFRMFVVNPGRIGEVYFDWAYNAAISLNPPVTWIAALIVSALFIVTGIIQNPHDDRRTLHGFSRLATYADLKRWKQWRDGWFCRKRQALSFLDESGIVLGRFKQGLKSSTYLRRDETLTALALAAPGIGKTQGIAIPTILSKGMDKWSMFIFDIKGELYEKTGGYRSSIGPVIRFEPSGDRGARWNPLSPMRSLPDEGQCHLEMMALQKALGELYGEDHAQDARISLQTLMRNDSDWRKTVLDDPEAIYPAGTAPASVNQKEIIRIIRDKVIPHARKMGLFQSQRETYLRKLSMGLVAEPDGGSQGNGKHFLDRARAAGFALMGLTICRAERDGVEPNFGRMIDLWSNALSGAGGDIDEDPQEQLDAVTEALNTLIDECKAYGYPEQIRQELIDLKTAGEEEKGGIFSSLANGLNIFKLSTVRERTSTSDFALEDMRGMTGKDGKSYPVTLYLVVSLENIQSMAQIMIMLTEAMQSRLISQPAHIASKARKVLFLLDEFAQIPKMQTLLSGPAVGRSQRVANLLIAQSYGQIEGKYGATGLKELKDTTEWKLIFPLTDSATAEDISKSIGNETIEDSSESGSYHGFGGAISAMFDGMAGKQITTSTNKSRSLKGHPLFSASDLMSTDNGGKMENGQQIILALRKYNRPIVCDTPFAYNDKHISKLTAIPAPEPDPDGETTNGMGFCGKLAHLHHVPAAKDKLKPREKTKTRNPFKSAA